MYVFFLLLILEMRQLLSINIHRKDLETLVCSESDCESPGKYLFKDLDGRALGLPPPVSVFPKTEGEWTGSFFNTGQCVLCELDNSSGEHEQNCDGLVVWSRATAYTGKELSYRVGVCAIELPNSRLSQTWNEVKVTQSCPTKFSRPKYWKGEPFPSLGDLPSPGIEPRSPALQVDSLAAASQGKPRNIGCFTAVT